MLRTPKWKYVEFPEYPAVLFDMPDDPGEEQNLAALPEHSATVAELHARLWDDGESWESLNATKEAARERAAKERSGHQDGSPNQYALADGTVVDAEEMLYGHIIRTE